MTLLIAQGAGQVTEPAPDLTQWWVGLVIGFTVIVVAVVLVSAILTLAARINQQARAGTAALEASRINTLPLWDVQKINDHARGILESARTLRHAAER